MKKPEYLLNRNHATRGNQRNRRWFISMAAIGAFLSLLTTPAHSSAQGAPNSDREVSVGIEGTVERVLNQPDYTPLPANENASLILRVHSVQRTHDGKYKYNLAYIGLQSGVYNLADYLQNSAGKRVRDSLPSMSVTVRALLPDDAPTTLPELPTALAPRRLPYRPTMTALILAWIGCGAALFFKPRPKPTEPLRPPSPPTKSLGAILEPLALKAARKTITTEEKILLEQTIIQFWSEKLEILDLNPGEKREAILEDEQGGALLRSVERWLYQPYSHILSSEISKVLAPYFDVPALEEGTGSGHQNLEESGSEDKEDDHHENNNSAEANDPDHQTGNEEKEEDHAAPAKEKRLTRSDSAASAPNLQEGRVQEKNKKQA